ncbi:hypothetical protein EON78_04130 [bacterium]|nr:MAG: hypothetical protein EON78_04130 [bacterium]
MTGFRKLLSTLMSLALIAGCSSGSDLVLTEPDNNISTSAEVFSETDRSMPIIVSFNNDYKGLITENEPIAKADSRSPYKYFIKLVNSARESINAALYDIQDPDIAAALIRAKNRGVNVRVTTDNDSLKDKEDPTKRRKVIVDMENAGIVVKDDKRGKLMHHKFLVVDNVTVWTGSMNVTTSSMYHHNNNSIMIRSPRLAENYNAEFKRMFEQNMYGPNPHTIPNKVVNVNGITIRTYFSPAGNTMSAVIDEMKKAKKSIKFMAFSMTDKNILATMIDKKKAGVNVEGVFDNCLIPQYSIFWDLKKADILALRDGNQALMHHKVMIIDDDIVITGSFNFSKSAEEGNNENTIILRSQSIAKQYNAEYGRIKSASLNNKDLPPYDHPACDKQENPNTTVPSPPVMPGQEEIPE